MSDSVQAKIKHRFNLLYVITNHFGLTTLFEGRERVKWELGFACFRGWEMGFMKKKIENGKLGNGIRSPPS